MITTAPCRQSLPESFFQLPRLQELTLANNALRAIPPELGRITTLQELYLNGACGAKSISPPFPLPPTLFSPAGPSDLSLSFPSRSLSSVQLNFAQLNISRVFPFLSIPFTTYLS